VTRHARPYTHPIPQCIYIFGVFFFLACVLWVETFLPVLSASAYVNVDVYTHWETQKASDGVASNILAPVFSIFQIHKWLISVQSNQHSHR
jgi:hypothetical protein